MRVLSALFVSATLVAVAPCRAAGFPDRPVTLIVPTTPGGSIDITARIVGEQLSRRWGQPVVIDNRAGAAMRIGATAAARAEPDGYTLLVAHDGTMAMNPFLFKNNAYDPRKDFAPVSLIGFIPEVLMMNKKDPPRNAEQFIAYAKAHPGALNHGSGGSATMLALAYLNTLAQIDVRDVLYRGGSAAVNAVIGGDVDICIADIATGAAGMQADSVVTLAVTSRERAPQLPNTPPLAEVGAPGYDVETWIGFFVPAKTPPEIVARVESAIKDIVKQPDVRAKLEKLGMRVSDGAAAAETQALSVDMAKWSKVIADNHIEVEQ